MSDLTSFLWCVAVAIAMWVLLVAVGTAVWQVAV